MNMKVATWDARSRRFRHGSIDSVGPKPKKGYPRYRTYAEVTGAPWRPHPENGWTTKPIRGHELDSESNQFAYLISKKTRSPTSSPKIPYKYTRLALNLMTMPACRHWFEGKENA